ncbi:MAG: proline dehydrogenase family protein [Acidobacteriota bacterium]
MSFLFRFARRFVAGESIQAALAEVKRLNDSGLLVTLDFLGENVASREEAVKAASTYVTMLEEIDRLKLKANVSLKLTQMGLDMGEEFCLEQVERIVSRAADFSNFVRIDMEGSGYTDRTLSVFEKAYKKLGNVGIVLQAYLHRTDKDVDRMIELKARVRLCKGAYAEPATIAIKSMPKIRENYMKLTEKLLKSKIYHGIATHDERLIKATAALAGQLGIAKDAFEFQMLYGIRPKRHLELVREGYNMRVYVPFGTHWLPYFYRRLRERKENVFFIISNLIRG